MENKILILQFRCILAYRNNGSNAILLFFN